MNALEQKNEQLLTTLLKMREQLSKADNEREQVYDTLGLKGGDRCVDGVKGFVFVQQNAIRLGRERIAELEAQVIPDHVHIPRADYERLIKSIPSTPRIVR